MELKKKIEQRFDAEVSKSPEGRLRVSVEPGKIKELCTLAKESGFGHLSTISATDFPDEERFGLSYFLWSRSEKSVLWVNTKIEREKPKITSLVELWGANAEAQEREIWELFGIEFEGNENLSQLFLEDWEGPPPFRKDFNWREYVQEEFHETEMEGDSID